MSNLIPKEKQIFNNFCEELLSNSPEYEKICSKYNLKDYSFDYLFFFNRVKIAASTSAKSLVKTVKDIRAELKIKNYPIPSNPFNDIIFPPIQAGMDEEDILFAEEVMVPTINNNPYPVPPRRL